MTLRKKTFALGSVTTLAGGATGAFLLALSATPAGAVGQTYVVDDLSDGNAVATDCITPVSGSCSLRDAIAASSGGDTITFQSGLTGTITLTDGQLELNGEVNLIGPGAANLTVDANQLSRVFYICSNSTPTEISGITITGGAATNGAGFYDECSGNVTFRNVVVTGNDATSGVGGGIQSLGSVTLIGSVVSNNVANGGGGGLGVSGNMVMTDSVVSGNTSNSGGGLNVTGNLVMTDSVVSGNTSNSGGGGFATYSEVDITNSTIENNTATACGGGLYHGGSNTTVNITDSTFSGNSTTTSCYGGAIDIDGNYNVVNISNTTITGNTSAKGGGLHIDEANYVNLFMDTITANNATSTDPLYSGGGVHIAGQRTFVAVSLSLYGTILSGNTAAAGPADIGYGYANTVTSTVIQANDSIVGDVDSRIAVVGTHVIRSTTPGLSPLANNGGLTKTMALLPTSAAIDAGPSTIPSFPGNEFDQRGAGYPRIVGTRSDIGAFEVQAAPAPTTTSSSDPVVPAFAG